MESSDRSKVPYRRHDGEAARVARHPPTIILAEDDEDLRSLLASALRNSGYRVTEVDTGRALLAELEQTMQGSNTPDLVISDFRMPQLSGLEVLRQTRRRGWAVPFVLITAFGDEQTSQVATRIGATEVLSKPFGLEELYATVSALIPGQEETAASRGGTPHERGDR